MFCDSWKLYYIGVADCSTEKYNALRTSEFQRQGVGRDGGGRGTAIDTREFQERKFCAFEKFSNDGLPAGTMHRSARP